MTTKKHTPTRQERYEERIGLIVTVADELDMILDEKNITKSAFAKLIGKSRSLVSRLLNGDHNMTLGTLSDVCTMLNIEPRITFTDKETGERLNPDYTGQKLYKDTEQQAYSTPCTILEQEPQQKVYRMGQFKNTKNACNDDTRTEITANVAPALRTNTRYA